mmetsp:Transcript_127849/g.355792  ORF Transcript_127849/g.355792 Transcript_127849/m.355792 type:complete len:268 (-) Transcript_127849:218-1021(-)
MTGLEIDQDRSTAGSGPAEVLELKIAVHHVLGELPDLVWAPLKIQCLQNEENPARFALRQPRHIVIDAPAPIDNSEPLLLFHHVVLDLLRQAICECHNGCPVQVPYGCGQHQSVRSTSAPIALSVRRRDDVPLRQVRPRGVSLEVRDPDSLSAAMASDFLESNDRGLNLLGSGPIRVVHVPQEEPLRCAAWPHGPQEVLVPPQLGPQNALNCELGYAILPQDLPHLGRLQTMLAGPGRRAGPEFQLIHWTPDQIEVLDLWSNASALC